MSALPIQKMTVDEFLAWNDTVPGRHELLDGVVHRMQAERVRHADRKFAVQTALRMALRRAGVACYMLPDGMTVRIDQHTAYEPDALVYCGDRLSDDAIEVRSPVIVVEVLSPSTGGIDSGRKLMDYFRLPSVMHYLIVDPVGSRIVHHARQTSGSILTSLVSAGTLHFHPPGIDVDVADIFAQV